ncbi:N-acyl-D-amino-acid deacylase family protein [Roseisolibacter agri]|uniref:Dihydroorotase n=1 Tax=Roseisolibacter agri TaxID=2014610 RepID=A0AA37Q4N3_9BACT|nr:D-aminoacylase [Roseisolibacter agri]GLC23702.1 dihydroorotase [Roseisolibacter agri]
MTTRLHTLLACVLASAALGACARRTTATGAPAPGAAYDVVITGGRLVDGTGNPWTYADVGVRGDRIVRVAPRGALANAPAAQRVDARGQVVAPGFIDIQSHSWDALLWRDGRVVGKVAQGVTTEILGEATTPAPVNAAVRALLGDDDPPGDAAAIPRRLREGFGGARGFGAWLDALGRHPNSVNVGSYLGATTVRAYAMGQRQGAADAAALDTMRRVVADAMRDGAFGVSSALIYPPGSFAGTAELIAQAQAMAPYHGTYITHMRSEDDSLFEAMDEAFRIGREGGVPVIIYHLKAAGRRNWPKAPRMVAKIDSARAAGQDVIATMYPYAASGNTLASCFPDWAAADGKLLANLADAAMRARIRAAMTDTAPGAPDYCQRDPGAVMVQGFRKAEWQRLNGLRIPAMAEALGKPWPDAVIDVVLGEENRLSKITFSMDEANVAMQLRRPWVVIGSDAGGQNPDSARGLTHPRAYGTYARVLGKYVRQDSVLTLEDAVRRMSGATAQALGLRDRGLVREGMLADLVVFDPATVSDPATFERPHQLAVGVRHVWVNGVAVWRDGRHTGATPGRVVRGPGWSGNR